MLRSFLILVNQRSMMALAAILALEGHSRGDSLPVSGMPELAYASSLNALASEFCGSDRLRFLSSGDKIHLTLPDGSFASQAFVENVLETARALPMDTARSEAGKLNICSSLEIHMDPPFSTTSRDNVMVQIGEGEIGLSGPFHCVEHATIAMPFKMFFTFLLSHHSLASRVCISDVSAGMNAVPIIPSNRALVSNSTNF